MNYLPGREGYLRLFERMRKEALWAIIITGTLMLVTSVLTASLAFFTWALALNGFMGQERAVNASMITFIALSVVFSVVCLALSLFSVYYLSVRRAWNAALAVILSVVFFSTAAGSLQLISVLFSAVVAEQMRTNK